jgi:FkbM family methyltransferase
MTSFDSSLGKGSTQRIILSISSGIGISLANSWLDRGIPVSGTYRTEAPALDALREKGANLVQCDLSDSFDIQPTLEKLIQPSVYWDVLVLASGTLEPVGPFSDNSMDEWNTSFNINFINPLRLLHGLLPSRRATSEIGPMVLFFAGSGSNGPTQNVSSYTMAKVSNIKMVELLDAEIEDTRFAVLGPGWVATKIHDAIISAGDRAGANLDRTRQMLDSNACVPLDKVVACCDWMISAPAESIGGRNISLVHDSWERPELLELLAADSEMYKLRRSGNDRKIHGNGSALPPLPAEQIRLIMDALPNIPSHHGPESSTYLALEAAARSAIVDMFGPGRAARHLFGPLGEIVFPYQSMGAIDSLDLFGLDELILFSFYWQNRNNYKRVADVGANIGLHSLVMAKCGFQSRSYEPDPRHVLLLENTLSSNDVDGFEIVEAAVSDKPGQAEFVRVLGNTTGSHLAGAKENPYGDLDRFNVELIAFSQIIEWADFIKIDAEGHEAVILQGARSEHWDNTDAMLEIGNQENARIIFDYCNSLGVNIFSQKTGWQRANTIEDIPTSYKHGSAFISRKPNVPGLTDK